MATSVPSSQSDVPYVHGEPSDDVLLSKHERATWYISGGVQRAPTGTQRNFIRVQRDYGGVQRIPALRLASGESDLLYKCCKNLIQGLAGSAAALCLDVLQLTRRSRSNSLETNDEPSRGTAGECNIASCSACVDNRTSVGRGATRGGRERKLVDTIAPR